MTQSTAIVRSDDGYEQAKEAVRDLVCGDCGSTLVILFMNGDGWAAKCPKDQAHPNRISHRQVEQDEIRQRLERNPHLSQALATQNARVPLTTDALKALSDEQLRSRIEVAFADVTEATPALRGQIMALSKLYGLDPVFDLMIYQHKPYITYDGRMRKLREAPLFRGETELRPLSKAEKEEWGFQPGDVVIKNTVDMGPHGLVSDFGVVRATGETSPVAKSHPQLLAIKRARARVSRVATGIDLPTVIDGQGRVLDIQPVDEQPRRALSPGDVETQQRKRFWATARAALPDGLGLTDDQVHQLLNVQSLNGYPGGWDQALSDLTMRVAESQTEDGDAPELDDDDDDVEDRSEAPQERQAGTETTAPPSVPEPVGDDLRAALERNAELVAAARDMGCRGLGSLTANESWPLDKVEQACTELEARLKSRDQELDSKSAREAGQAGF